MASTITLNWSKDSQVFCVDGITAYINTICTNATPLHDLLYCIMHLIGLVDLEDGFLYSSESKVVLLEECLRLLMDPKVLNVDADQNEKVKIITYNILHLNTDRHCNVPSQLLNIAREVRVNIDKFLPYLPYIQDFIYKEEKLKQENFAVDVSSEADTVSSHLDPKFNFILDKLKEVIDQIIEFIEAYNPNDMVLSSVLI